MPKRTNTSLLNRTNVKKFALAMAENRAHKFERVSAEFLDKAEGALRKWAADYVRSLPSVSKTIK